MTAPVLLSTGCHLHTTTRRGHLLPPFRPAWGLRGGHRQTLAGFLFSGLDDRHRLTRSVLHRITTRDGHGLAVHEDRPPAFHLSDPIDLDSNAVLLIHGLGGSHQSPHLVRAAHVLLALGYVVYRLDLRGTGAGETWAPDTYNAARTDDIDAVMEWMAARHARLNLLGFSLGGALALRWAAEHAPQLDAVVDHIVTVCSPVDLAGSVRCLRRPRNVIYDRYFAQMLVRQVTRRADTLAAAPRLGWGKRPPRSLYDFDSYYTAPVAGFTDAESYYALTTPGPLLERITIPTTLLVADDDPFVPSEQYDAYPISPLLEVVRLPFGGHMGFLQSAVGGGWHRWLDAALDALFRQPSQEQTLAGAA